MSAIGGAITASLFFIPSHLLTSISDFYELIIKLLVIVFFLLLEIQKRTSILPAGNFAVPATWLVSTDKRVGMLWGLVLGLGVITYQAGSLFLLYLLFVLFSDNILIAIFAGIVYGLTRTLSGSIPLIRKKLLFLADYPFRNTVMLSYLRRNLSILTLVILLVHLIIRLI